MPSGWTAMACPTPTARDVTPLVMTGTLVGRLLMYQEPSLARSQARLPPAHTCPLAVTAMPVLLLAVTSMSPSTAMRTGTKLTACRVAMLVVWSEPSSNHFRPRARPCRS